MKPKAETKRAAAPRRRAVRPKSEAGGAASAPPADTARKTGRKPPVTRRATAAKPRRHRTPRMPAPVTAPPARAEDHQAPTAAVAAPPTHEQVARRAYEIFVARGGQPGNPFEDWVRAEYELWEERRRAGGA